MAKQTSTCSTCKSTHDIVLHHRYERCTLTRWPYTYRVTIATHSDPNTKSWGPKVMTVFTVKEDVWITK